MQCNAHTRSLDAHDSWSDGGGGGRSFLHATHASGLGASVVYYGSPPGTEQMASIKAPVLGRYGGNDARINATIPSADSAMKRRGKSYEYHIVDGAGHGFPRAQDGNEATGRGVAPAGRPYGFGSVAR
jgi:carboxymethylenebutenolidase